METPPPTAGNEADLSDIRRILQGEKDRYGELVRRHETKVYRLCLAFLHDPHDAEEAAQEVFIRAYRSLASFRGGSSFLTWLTRIGINHCKDLLHRKKRFRFIPLDLFTSGEAPHPPELIQNPQEPIPDGLPEAKKALETLPEAEKTVLVLFEVEELSYEEVASTLGISLDAVKGRLKRARERLRHFLGAGPVQ